MVARLAHHHRTPVANDPDGLPAVWRRLAAGASDRQLAACLAAGALGPMVMAFTRFRAWPVPLLLIVIGAFGMWAVSARVETHIGVSGTPPKHAALQVIRILATLVAIAALGLSMFLMLAWVIGPWVF